MDYQPLLIAVGTNDPTNTRYRIYDTLADFSCYVRHVPFRIWAEPKNILTQSWHDADGDDEYLPQQLRYKGYELPIDFVYAGAYGDANEAIARLLNTLAGRWLKLYDSYTGIGRQQVRLHTLSDDATLYRRRGVGDYVQFCLTFKVNDPITNITLP